MTSGMHRRPFEGRHLVQFENTGSILQFENTGSILQFELNIFWLLTCFHIGFLTSFVREKKSPLLCSYQSKVMIHWRACPFCTSSPASWTATFLKHARLARKQSVLDGWTFALLNQLVFEFRRRCLHERKHEQNVNYFQILYTPVKFQASRFNNKKLKRGQVNALNPFVLGFFFIVFLVT